MNLDASFDPPNNPTEYFLHTDTVRQTSGTTGQSRRI
jgi:hypothetical protein